MRNNWLTPRAAMIKIVCVFVLLAASLGCTRESRIITGKVVDESNVALDGVVVTACYSGWGWSSGQLVWDKDFCSEPVVTDSEGLYVINFKGPDFLRLRAKKNGWIQTQDFHSKDSQIVLIQNEVYSARIAAEASLREEDFRKWLSDESDVEYYCRVIIPQNRPITLNYRGETLSIVTSVLLPDYSSDALFAVRGSALGASSFTQEAELRINGKAVIVNFSSKSDEGTCEPGIHFIRLPLPGMPLETGGRIEVFIPSIRAMFDMQPLIDTVKPKYRPANKLINRTENTSGQN